MAREPAERCFCCGKALPKSRRLVACRDEQEVYVGSDCFRLIAAAGVAGHQPKIGGPRLYTLENKPAPNDEQRVRVTLSLEPCRQYEVAFLPGGKVRVWALFERSPVNRRGHYQADSGSREIRANGPTGLRAINAAASMLDTRAAIETETVQ